MKKQLFTFLACLTLLGSTRAQSVWQVSTFAGNSTTGATNGTGPGGSFNSPRALCIDPSGNIYVADSYNNLIRKITPAGVISTLAGSGQAGFADGTGTSASFSRPTGVAADASGNIYVVDPERSLIRKITPAGVVSTFASCTGSAIYGICVGQGGNIFVTDYVYNKVLKITPSGVVSTYATGFNNPDGICADAAGNIYVTNYFSNSVSKITTAGVVTTFASGIPSIFGLCIDNAGNLYAGGRANQICKITSSGVVSVIAGGSFGSTDDIGTKASFYNPDGICADASGNLYVADVGNNKIRKMQLVLPTPPVPNYNLPANMCLGATANYQPATTGSQAGITLQMDSSLTVPAPKGICRNKNGVFVLSAADSVLFYDFNGNLQFTYNTMPLFQNITAIAADDANRLYLVGPDQLNASMKSVYRLDAQGNWDTQFSLANYQLNSVSAIAFGPGKLYVVDTLGPYIDLIDTASSGSPIIVTALPQPGNLQYSFYKPTSMVFGSNGQMYLADAGNKAILARNASDNNYYAVDSLLGIHQSFSFDMDSNAVNSPNNNTFYITSDISPTIAWHDITSLPSNSGSIISHHADTVPFMHLRNPAGTVYINHGGTVPISWTANSGGNNVMRVSVFFYSITPPLPAGLNYNFITGKITGSPVATAPFTTYTISTQSTAGTNTTTIAFSVVPPGPISNTVGSNSSAVVNHADGLTVNYFNTSDCSQMISIQDAPGGTVLGNTIATQTVYPTIATFNADTFVGRVTEVATQSPDSALANVQLNFTYQDIQHYNASVAPSYTLSNDTTVTKTMKVGILQLHTKKTGSKQPIAHSPLIANWVTAHHQWEIKFAVTKFSTFYMGDTTKVTGFQCENGSADTILTTNTFYIWHNDSLFFDGDYADTLINAGGCDSICKLHLTISPSTGISTPLLNASTSVCPNPSTGLLNITVNNPNVEIRNIRITNIMGQEVYSSSDNNHNLQLDLSSIPKGYYTVTLTSKQECVTKKILLE